MRYLSQKFKKKMMDLMSGFVDDLCEDQEDEGWVDAGGGHNQLLIFFFKSRFTFLWDNTIHASTI